MSISQLPQEYFAPDSSGSCLGLEPGFMSTTASRHFAMRLVMEKRKSAIEEEVVLFRVRVTPSDVGRLGGAFAGAAALPSSRGVPGFGGGPGLAERRDELSRRRGLRPPPRGMWTAPPVASFTSFFFPSRPHASALTRTRRHNAVGHAQKETQQHPPR